jgi:hypothetical protein
LKPQMQILDWRRRQGQHLSQNLPTWMVTNRMASKQTIEPY